MRNFRLFGIIRHSGEEWNDDSRIVVNQINNDPVQARMTKKTYVLLTTSYLLLTITLWAS